jgi:tetratricopeptide (TPR) repeat protein
VKLSLFIYLILVIFLICPFPVKAESTTTKLPGIDSKLPITIMFEYSGLNNSPNPDGGIILIFKDAASGKIIKINLQKKSEKTPLYVGEFAISWATKEEIKAEIYFPSQKTILQKDSTSLMNLIRDGYLVRKPYFFRRSQNKQILTVYNSPEQALAASESYRKSIPSVVPVENIPLNTIPVNKPVVEASAIEAQHKIELELEQVRLANAAKEQEMLRLKIEEEQKLKQEEMLKAQAAMAEAERAQRKSEAQANAIKAMALFKSEKFPEAAERFKKSIELDPSNNTYYFQYGVSLFKTDKFNEALVAFGIASENATDLTELNFYKGLCHMKLKDFPNALIDFTPVSLSNNKVMGPSASFFIGIIFFSQAKYRSAKKYFEKTVDTSDDPRMSDQADNYIEQIANIEQFEDKKKHPFTGSVTTGMMYDSNILSLSDETAKTVKDKAGLRLLVTAALDYRIIFNETWEHSFSISYVDMFTNNTSLKPSAALQKADPQILQYKLPLKLKTKLSKIPYQVTFTPGYDTLNLNVDSDSTREPNQKSTYLNVDQTFVISKDYITSIGIELRNDDSLVADDNSADAAKTSITNSNILFQDVKKTEAILANWGYSINNAKGDDKKANKLDLSIGYLMPAFKKDSLVTQLAYSNTDYNKSTAHRKDSGITILASYSHLISQALKSAVALSYNINNSNVDTSKYNKLGITTTLSWSDEF